VLYLDLLGYVAVGENRPQCFRGCFCLSRNSGRKINKINLIFFCRIDKVYLIDMFTHYRVYLIV
jgi:hypothetical protein